jgi:uncharacterized protein YnzC (UPF0291/DUF896 family)
MGIARLVVSIAALGLAVSVAQPSLAQPGRGKLRPLPGAPDYPGGKTRPYPGDPGPGGAVGQPGQPPGKGPSAANFKRIGELRQKKAAGTLTDEEKAEYENIRQRLGPPRRHRQARLAELEKKKSDGKLTDEEKKELERIEQIRERHEALKQKHAERKQSRAKRRLAAKRKALTESPALRGSDQAALAEYGKHGQRMAMLERAREVAEAEGRDDLVTRIDKLIAKEQQRHQKWVANHAGGTP